MSNKILGNILVVGGIGALVYLYIGYYKPKQLALQDVSQVTKKA